MAKTTSIEWCDHTWTPVVGCDPVSPACANCYAATMAARLEAMGMEKYRGVAVRVGGKGKWTGKVNFSEADLVKPLTVRKAARWFLTSMGDVAHDKLTWEQIAEMFGVMAVAGATGAFHREEDGYTIKGGWTASDGTWIPAKWPNHRSGPHTFMVLTKRAERMADLLLNLRFRKLVSHAAYRWAHNRVTAGDIAGGIYPDWSDWDGDATKYWPLPNVFIGCTAEDQARTDELRPHMASIAAAGWKTFVSYEPALGQVDWTGWEFLKQLISGGESGHKARPSHPDWHRAARDFCAAHGIPYMMKQLGCWTPGENVNRHSGTVETATLQDDCWLTSRENLATADGHIDDQPDVYRAGKKAAGRLLDGVTHDGFPAPIETK
jgi:protein gp37